MSSLTEAEEKTIIAKVLAARENRDQFLREMKKRQTQGLKVARQCADFLKQNYGVTKVILFGSLLDHQKMHLGSDIDLAVWGLPEKDYLKAVGYLLDLAGDFSVDLVEAQHAQPQISLAIEQGRVL